MHGNGIFGTVATPGLLFTRLLLGVSNVVSLAKTITKYINTYENKTEQYQPNEKQALITHAGVVPK